MGYLIHFVLAFIALAADENGLGFWRETPSAVLALAAVPHLLLQLTRRAFLRGDFRRAQLVENALIWSPPLLYFAALAGFGWGATVERWTGIATGALIWPHPAELLALAPFAIYSFVSIDARARVADTRDVEIARTRRFHLRMFSTGLVPLVVLVLGAWGLSRNDVLRIQLEEVGLFSGGLGVSTVAVFVLLLPAVLIRLWDTEPMPPGPRRDMLEAVASGARFRCREILVWITGQRMANAAVLGLGPRTRVVLFTDALLSQLSLRELRAVFAHEIGHAHHHHAATFLAWALGYFLGLDLLTTLLPEISELVSAALLAAAFLVWWAGFGWLSRRVELEADLYGLENTGDLSGLILALERVGSTHARRLSSWRHFSTEKRVRELERASEDPEHGRRLHRRLRRAAWLGAALAIITTGLEARNLVERYPTDRLRADVRLGAYASASRRLGRIGLAGPEDEALARALERGAELGDGVGPQELAGAARRALRARDLVAAEDLASLALWRGAADLEPVVLALAAHREGADPDLADVGEPWIGDLERALRTGSR